MYSKVRAARKGTTWNTRRIQKHSAMNVVQLGKFRNRGLPEQVTADKHAIIGGQECPQSNDRKSSSHNPYGERMLTTPYRLHSNCKGCELCLLLARLPLFADKFRSALNSLLSVLEIKEKTAFTMNMNGVHVSENNAPSIFPLFHTSVSFSSIFSSVLQNSIFL